MGPWRGIFILLPYYFRLFFIFAIFPSGSVSLYKLHNLSVSSFPLLASCGSHENEPLGFLTVCSVRLPMGCSQSVRENSRDIKGSPFQEDARIDPPLFAQAKPLIIGDSIMPERRLEIKPRL